MSLLDNFSKFLPFSGKKDKKEYYFALNIYSKSVEAAIWGVERGKLILVNSATSSLGSHNLSEAANLCLDEALLDFQPEPTQILFGVPDFWLQDDELKEDYSHILKDLVKDLDLTPLAYVSLSHAISHLLQKQQGVPLTAILIDFSNPLMITVVKGGKVISTKSLKRAGSLAEDIEKGLLAFSEVEVLPSKILVYGGMLQDENAEKLKDELHSFPWMQNLPFLHLPKIDILNEMIAISGTAFAGASEINPSVVFNEDSLEQLKKVKPLLEHSSLGKIDNLEDVKMRSHEEKEKHKLDSKSDLEDVGFVSGDIENVEPEGQDISDIEEELAPEIDERSLINSREYPIHVDHDIEEKHVTEYTPSKSGGLIAALLLKRIELLLPILIVVLLIASYIFLPKAKVVVFIDPKILEKDEQVTVDPTITSVDDANKKIPGKIVSANLTGSQKGQASGTKQIGDPAKGKVNIYNLSANKVSLPSGASLSSSSGLKIILDSSVEIASQSASVGADFTTVTTPGKASSGVTASAIGPDSNLPAGTNLNVAGYNSSQVVAKVDQALSGGTSKNVTVVTSDDQKKLLAQATSDLRSKAKDQLQGQLSDGFKILEEGLTENNVSASYSKKVNDQASDFTINLSINFKGSAYSDSDLKTMVSKLVSTEVPPGYTLNLQDAQTQADVAKTEKDGKIIFLAKFKAKLMPTLDKEKIKQQIKGKTPTEAINEVKKIDNVISSEIKISPSLPGPLQRLPFLVKNISIDVQAK